MRQGTPGAAPDPRCPQQGAQRRAPGIPPRSCPAAAQCARGSRAAWQWRVGRTQAPAQGRWLGWPVGQLAEAAAPRPAPCLGRGWARALPLLQPKECCREAAASILRAPAERSPSAGRGAAPGSGGAPWLAAPPHSEMKCCRRAAGACAPPGQGRRSPWHSQGCTGGWLVARAVRRRSRCCCRVIHHHSLALLQKVLEEVIHVLAFGGAIIKHLRGGQGHQRAWGV